MSVPTPHIEAINAEMDSWISGRTISRQTVDQFGTVIAVTEGKAGYRVLRAFGLGDGAGVSVDLQTDNIEDVVEHLLCHYKL